MLINKKWRNSALNCEAYNSFISVNSDHRIITLKLRLSLRTHKNKTTNKINYDWKCLASDIEMKTAYTIEDRNRFEALQTENENQNATCVYNKIIEAHSKTAEKIILRKQKAISRIPWEIGNVRMKQKAVKEAQSKVAERNTRSANRTLEKAKTELEKAYTTELKNFVNEKNNTITNAMEDQKSQLAWKTVNEITG